MKVTTTGIAVALAVAFAFGLIFFGSSFFTSSLNPNEMTDAPNLAPAAGGENEPLPAELPTTLTATDFVEGTGAEAVSGSTVSVHYTGMLPDGTVFDSSVNRGPFTLQLGAGMVIQGWDQGLVGMKEGGKRRLIIPADMAYGAQGVPGVIPPNATLIFDVEMLDVQ